VTLHDKLRDVGAIGWEDSLDTLASHDAAHRKHLGCARAATSDHDTREELNSLFVAFLDAAVNFDRVTDREDQWIRPETSLLDGHDECITHDITSSSCETNHSTAGR